AVSEGGVDKTRQQALKYAAGVELVHTSALVADDIIDRSDVRRGVPSVHESYGHSMAVLSSNKLLGKALEVIDDERAVSAMVDAVRNLGEGEAIELVNGVTTVDDYMDLAYRKTAALFVASCEAGAIAGDATDDEEAALKEYGEHLGIAFQIRDDMLDYTSTQDDLGKPVGKDALLERPSLVVIHSRNEGVRLTDSVEFARQRALSRIERAREALEPLTGDNRDEENDPVDDLRSITDFVVKRSK
ncbi:MAG: polyprenyl synthetase family protein, partial [Halobacteria archaeon]|nr:polyprenyl synthetase family protein [Halobacteria archaeon]